MMTKIFVVDDSEMNLKMVSALLSKEGYEAVTAMNGEQALSRIGAAAPELAILDVMMPDMDGYELCRRLRERPDTAHIPIIILTALSELDERLKAFDAGADDFIAKPFQPQELLARIKVLLRRASLQVRPVAEQAQGNMLAFFSLRGGVGISSLATNLAIGLAQVWSRPVALVDLALLNGMSALMLDLPLRNSWSDLASIKEDEIDGDVISRILLKHDSGVRVLAAPRRPQEAEMLTSGQVPQTLEVLRQQNDYAVLDLPHDFNAVTLAGLDAADTICLMLSPELAAVRLAGIALDVFRELDYPGSKVKLVLNWPFKGKGLQRAEIENTLKQKIDIVIPYMEDALVMALTLGKPPVFQDPASPVGAFFEDIAYHLSSELHKTNPPQPLPDGFLRVRERAAAKQKMKL
jgi:pilus assembly protein CpaE